MKGFLDEFSMECLVYGRTMVLVASFYKIGRAGPLEKQENSGNESQITSRGLELK